MWDSLVVQPFVNILLFIYSLVGNFGIAIILFTLLIRVITHPLTVQQLKGTAQMQEMQKDPRWVEGQVKYKNDREKLAQLQMELYKEYNVNLGASCLPTLIQLPILFGLYQALYVANATTPVELLSLARHIYPSFLNVANLLPLNSQFLWMDMGQPERLFIPGIPFGIPVLAVVVVITTYLQSKLMSPPTGSGDQQSNMMMGMMNIYMPFFMGWIALSYASGLSLYFVASNLIGIGQYAILGRLNWDNVLPWKKKPAAQPARKSSGQAARPQPEAKSDAKPEAKPSLQSGATKETAKATKTVKATKPVGKPGKMNPKPK